jgi:hypothetical protein
MPNPARALATLLCAATFMSCNEGTRPRTSTPTSSAAPAASHDGLSVDPAGTTVYRDSVGVAAVVRNSGPHGIRDIKLSIDYFAGDRLVLTQTDVLAFCPASATCPWGTVFGATEDDHRSIESAQVRIASVGPKFDDGVVRRLNLRVDATSVSFDLPAQPGVAILYVLDADSRPRFGLFASHQSADETTIRLTDSTLPIGPQTRGVFYAGHIPESMLAGGH